MVLNREEDKSLGILLQQRLVTLLCFDSWSNGGRGLLICLVRLINLLDICNLGLVVVDLLSKVGDRGLVGGLVLFVSRVKINFLDWRLHLERVNGRSSLMGTLG